MFKALQQVNGTSVRLCAEGTLHPSMSREAAVRTLCALAAEGSALAIPLTDAALAREEEEDTYIGRGLAVPHARVEGLEHARICLATCPAGLNWGSHPATLVALLAVPTARPELHLRLLATLAKQLSATSSPSLPALAAALEAVR